MKKKILPTKRIKIIANQTTNLERSLNPTKHKIHSKIINPYLKHPCYLVAKTSFHHHLHLLARLDLQDFIIINLNKKKIQYILPYIQLQISICHYIILIRPFTKRMEADKIKNHMNR
jgi:hypothetical protein